MIPDRKTAESCMAAMGWYVGPSVCVCVCVCAGVYISVLVVQPMPVGCVFCKCNRENIAL